MIGDEHVNAESVAEIETVQGILRLLSPTDCVKDRLAGYYYFNDRQCLEQALLVAKEHSINIAALKKWHITERQLKGYEQFIEMLKKS